MGIGYHMSLRQSDLLNIYHVRVSIKIVIYPTQAAMIVIYPIQSVYDGYLSHTKCVQLLFISYKVCTIVIYPIQSVYNCYLSKYYKICV